MKSDLPLVNNFERVKGISTLDNNDMINIPCTFLEIITNILIGNLLIAVLSTNLFDFFSM